MKTILHYYLCDLTKMEGIRELKRIQRETRGVPERLGEPGTEFWLQMIKLDKQTIELPTIVNFTCFQNSQEIYFLHYRFDHLSKPIAEGYYLEMTDEMRDARDNTYRCPTCSSLRPNDHTYFCLECVHNEIEVEKDLYKAFFRPVSVINVLPKNVLIPKEIKEIWREHHKQTQTI